MGKIILLNTPIGNLGDLTPRVLEALKEGTHFAVEDTRVFKELLNHLGISLSGKNIYSLHDQSESFQIKKLLSLAENQTLFVASEAGSPIISDPAYPLVLAAYEKGLTIDSCSGISSPIMALELSGLPPIPFHFHGFLPRESGKKINFFKECSYGTHIFFEAPTRVEETLDELTKNRPDVDICIVREMSKKFQQVVKFKAADWIEKKKLVNFKGEFVVLFNNSHEGESMNHEIKILAQEILDKGNTPKAMAKLIGLILDKKAKEVYTQISKKPKPDD